MSRPERSPGDRILASPTVQTLVAFLVVFVAMHALAGVWEGFLHLFVLSSPITAKPWTLVTSVYSHAGLGHLIGNSVALVLVGLPLERATKSWAFHLFFVTTGAVAGLSQIWAVEVLALLFAVLEFLVGWLVAVPTVEGEVAVLGASGAVFAMFGYVLAGNRLADGLLRAYPVPGWLQVGAFLVVAVAITWWTAAPGVALVAHFVGLLVGLVAGRVGVLPTDRSGTAREDPAGT